MSMLEIAFLGFPIHVSTIADLLRPLELRSRENHVYPERKEESSASEKEQTLLCEHVDRVHIKNLIDEERPKGDEQHYSESDANGAQ